MKEDITQSDGFADGMLLVSAASYPVIRGAVGVVGGVIDESRRKALIERGAELTRSAADVIPLVRPRLEAIDQALQGLGIEGPRRSLQLVITLLTERIRWFSPSNIREFVEANEVEALLLSKELGEFLVAPVRDAVDAIRHEIDGKRAGNLLHQLRDLELSLIKFAAEKFDADISRHDEPSHLIRSWFVKAARIGAILVVGIAGLLAIAFLSLR